jgi:hypothetical protein
VRSQDVRTPYLRAQEELAALRQELAEARRREQQPPEPSPATHEPPPRSRPSSRKASASKSQVWTLLEGSETSSDPAGGGLELPGFS